MAKASWCNVSPMSGSENGTLTISAGAHTGRVARNTVVTVTAAHGTRPSAGIAVSQAGIGTETTMDSTKPAVPAAGGTVIINGTSTSSTLRWDCVAELLGIRIPIQNVRVTVNSREIENDESIPDDPGASERFGFVATITVPASKLAMDATITFKVTDDTGVSKTCTFTWKAGASTLSVSRASLSLLHTGAGQTVNVTSNDDWNVS